MVSISDIGWASYKQYEGPFFRGTTWFHLPSNPTDAQRLVAVTSSTEGAFDSINSYDRAIISVGILQLAEIYYLTSTLLGKIAERDLALLDPLKPALAQASAGFKLNSKKQMRFFLKGGEVTSTTQQQRLFHLRSNGLKGSWDEESKNYAKLWAASIANVLVQDTAIKVQLEFSAKRIQSFALPSARRILWGDELPSAGWIGALRAGFLSFAVNLPAVASKHLDTALKTAPGSKWSPDWCIHVLKELTFGPKIAIYPHRYNAIRPVIEKLYGVDLPDFAKELETWKAKLGTQHETEPAFTDPTDIAKFLASLDYDLGPTGCRLKEAVRQFQKDYKLQVDGIVGPKTRAKLLQVWRRSHPDPA